MDSSSETRNPDSSLTPDEQSTLTPSPSSSPTKSLTPMSSFISDANFTTSPDDPPPPEADPNITYLQKESFLAIIATIRIPNSCHELKLNSISVENRILSVVIASEDTSSEAVNCSSEASFGSYSLEIQFNDSLTQSLQEVQLLHPLGDTITYSV